MILKCPKCSGAIEYTDGRARCQRCSKDWGNEYPDFIEKDFYWGELPQKQMQEICEYAKLAGWGKALEEKLLPNYPTLFTYAIEENRADWRILLDINESSIILDLGAGWGTISSILSDYAAEVYALEGVKERIEFLNLRRIQEEKWNIHPLRADFHNPPFFENTFDLIVCNGVLEWVGLNNLSTSPRKAQVNFLNKMFGLLKHKGILYIGIENRFSYSSFLGANDHSGLPYTNLLPRILANIIVKLNALFKGKTKDFFLSRKGGYRTYTYSVMGYKRLLEEAGFTDIKIYSAIPSYNSPGTLIPIDSSEMYKFYLKTIKPFPLRISKKVLRKIYKMIINIGIQKWFENAYSIIAIK